MNKKKINFESILHVFEGDHQCPITDLVDQITGSMDDLGDASHTIDEQVAFDLALEQKVVAFAIGYAVAKMLDIGKSEAEAIQAVEQIKDVIRESEIFPYLPIKTQGPNSSPGNAPVVPTP